MNLFSASFCVAISILGEALLIYITTASDLIYHIFYTWSRTLDSCFCGVSYDFYHISYIEWGSIQFYQG